MVFILFPQISPYKSPSCQRKVSVTNKYLNVTFLSSSLSSDHESCSDNDQFRTPSSQKKGKERKKCHRKSRNTIDRNTKHKICDKPCCIEKIKNGKKKNKEECGKKQSKQKTSRIKSRIGHKNESEFSKATKSRESSEESNYLESSTELNSSESSRERNCKESISKLKFRESSRKRNPRRTYIDEYSEISIPENKTFHRGRHLERYRKTRSSNKSSRDRKSGDSFEEISSSESFRENNSAGSHRKRYSGGSSRERKAQNTSENGHGDTYDRSYKERSNEENRRKTSELVPHRYLPKLKVPDLRSKSQDYPPRKQIEKLEKQSADFPERRLCRTASVENVDLQFVSLVEKHKVQKPLSDVSFQNPSSTNGIESLPCPTLPTSKTKGQCESSSRRGSSTRISRARQLSTESVQSPNVTSSVGPPFYFKVFTDLFIIIDKFLVKIHYIVEFSFNKVRGDQAHVLIISKFIKKLS